jgi:UDP-glucose 6-dehydrogenase
MPFDVFCSRCNRYYVVDDVLNHLLAHTREQIMTAFSDSQATINDAAAALQAVLPNLQGLNGTLDFSPLLSVIEQVVAIIPAPAAVEQPAE